MPGRRLHTHMRQVVVQYSIDHGYGPCRVAADLGLAESTVSLILREYVSRGHCFPKPGYRTGSSGRKQADETGLQREVFQQKPKPRKQSRAKQQNLEAPPLSSALLKGEELAKMQEHVQGEAKRGADKNLEGNQRHRRQQPQHQPGGGSAVLLPSMASVLAQPPLPTTNSYSHALCSSEPGERCGGHLTTAARMFADAASRHHQLALPSSEASSSLAGQLVPVSEPSGESSHGPASDASWVGS